MPDGFQVVITGTNGTIYYTLNGSDPRAAGGAVAAGAQAYQGPVPLQNQTLVQARVKNGSNWSGLATAVFYTPTGFVETGNHGNYVQSRRSGAAGTGMNWNSSN